MNIRILLFSFFAIAAVVGTVLFARQWAAGQRAQVNTVTVEKKEPAVGVLVAAADIPAGMFVQRKNLKWQTWPKSGVGKSFITDAGGKDDAEKLEAGFSGAVARSTIRAGEPITGARLVQPGDRGFLAAVLSPGSRAVSVPVNATTGIAGFVFPGDDVDLIITIKFKGKDAEGNDATRYFTRTLMRKVRVIAIDQKTENEDGKVKPVKNVTVEVTPKQAERIAIANNMGELSLSLHSLARDQGLLTASSEILPPPPAAGSFTLDSDVFFLRGAAANPKSGQVIVIRGEKAENASF